MINPNEDFSKLINIADPEKSKYEMKQSGEDRGLILPTNALDQHNTVLLPNTLGRLGEILQAIIDGDEKALNSPEFTALNFDNIKAAIEWLAKTDQLSDAFKTNLLTEGWRLNYKCKPPTPEEFLSIKYIGPTAETLFEPIKKAFIEFMDPLRPYRNGIWYSCIGTGKAQPYSSKVATGVDDNNNFIYSNIGDLKIGDTVLTPTTKDGEYDKAKVGAIQEQGLSDVYIIELSNGKSYRTHLNHYTTVCFRQENGKEIWDTLTTKWMMQHPEYHFTLLPNIKSFDDISILSILPCHEAEPSDNIQPITKDGIYIKRIYKADYKENCRCISLNDPLGLYYTNDGIITHNSTLTALVNLYISTLFAMMWHPYKYFGLSSATVFVQALGAWSQKKGSEILLEPIKNIIESSPYFTQVRGHADMVEGNEDPTEIAEHLNWTTATKTAQPLDCKIYLPDGTYKLMGDIKVGDVIASPTCGEVTVEAIPYHGIDTCYEIELEDGRKTRCNAEHLWKVSWEKDEENKPIWKVVQTQFMLDHPELEFEIFDVGDVG